MNAAGSASTTMGNDGAIHHGGARVLDEGPPSTTHATASRLATTSPTDVMGSTAMTHGPPSDTDVEAAASAACSRRPASMATGEAPPPRRAAPASNGRPAAAPRHSTRRRTGALGSIRPTSSWGTPPPAPGPAGSPPPWAGRAQGPPTRTTPPTGSPPPSRRRATAPPPRKAAGTHHRRLGRLAHPTRPTSARGAAPGRGLTSMFVVPERLRHPPRRLRPGAAPVPPPPRPVGPATPTPAPAPPPRRPSPRCAVTAGPGHQGPPGFGPAPRRQLRATRLRPRRERVGHHQGHRARNAAGSGSELTALQQRHRQQSPTTGTGPARRDSTAPPPAPVGWHRRRTPPPPRPPRRSTARSHPTRSRRRPPPAWANALAAPSSASATSTTCSWSRCAGSAPRASTSRSSVRKCPVPEHVLHLASPATQRSARAYGTRHLFRPTDPLPPPDPRPRTSSTMRRAPRGRLPTIGASCAGQLAPRHDEVSSSPASWRARLSAISASVSSPRSPASTWSSL